MITDIFRLDDNVPRIYVNESRDFQMLCRLFTYGINPSRYEAETLHYLNNGMLTNDRLLSNLCEKTGFMDGESIKGEYLRYITDNFGRLVRDKGAETGILNTVYLYLLMYNLSTSVYLNIDKKNYVIYIGIKSSVRDIEVLYTILKYIVPTGWIIEIFFYAEMQVWQGYAYKDTFVNLVRKASATNALYIISTNRENIGSMIGKDGNKDDPIIYDKFGDGVGGPDSKGNIYSSKSTIRAGETHITKYTGSAAINAMSSMQIESFMDNPEELAKYGTELWDARKGTQGGGNFRFNKERYRRAKDGKRK